MKLSREFLDKLKDSVDLVELCGEYTELKRISKDKWRGICPHPLHNDSTPSFTVNKLTNSWCCYGCHNAKKDIKHNNYGTDAIAFIQWINQGKLSWFECVKYLADKTGIAMPTDKNEKIYKRHYKINQKYMRDMTPEAYDYLLFRGLDDSDIEEWQIGFDLTTQRITFPLIDINGIVGFNKRRIDGINDKKYINPENNEMFKKSEFLFGLNKIDRSYEYVFITEGVMDVIMAHKYGLKNVVCILGSAFSEHHYDIINKLHLKPVLLFDSDKKGISCRNSAMELIYNKGEYCLISNLPKEYDLCDYSLKVKDKLTNNIESSIMTYGYTKAKDIIDTYNQELYKLKVQYRYIINDIMNSVPDNEKKDIQGFIERELKIII